MLAQCQYMKSYCDPRNSLIPSIYCESHMYCGHGTSVYQLYLSYTVCNCLILPWASNVVSIHTSVEYNSTYKE